MSDLPEAVDAQTPGVFDFGGLRLFNLGGDVWLITGKDRPTVDSACKQLKERLPEATVLGVGTMYDTTYTPLEQSLDLTRTIRLIVREELDKMKAGANEPG